MNRSKNAEEIAYAPVPDLRSLAPSGDGSGEARLRDPKGGRATPIVRKNRPKVVVALCGGRVSAAS